MATAMVGGYGNLGAGRQHRGAFPGQELGHVQLALGSPGARQSGIIAAELVAW